MAENEAKSGWRWLLEKRRWLWLLLGLCAIVGMGGAAWWIGLRWLLLLAMAGGLLAVFHPWDCWIRWRVSWRGQRGEAWFRYLFGTLGVGVSGSPAGARILVAIGPWRRTVFDTRARRESPPGEPPSPSGTEPVSPSQESHGKTLKMVVPVEQADAPPPVHPIVSASEAPPVPAPDITSHRESGIERVQETSHQPSTEVAPQPAKGSEVEPATTEIATPVPIAPEVSKEELGPGEPLARPVPPVEDAQPTPVMDFDRDPGRLSPPPHGTAAGGGSFGSEPPKPPSGFGGDDGANEDRSPSWRERLRALRRRFRSGWQKVRKGYRIARDIWNRATEPCRRLLWNLWASFTLLGPKAHLRYGLSEPHIVGMIQGVLAPLAGIAMPFGALIRVEPVFSAPTVWCRGETGLRIHPWKVAWALARLVTEREVIRGVRDAWRAWKDRNTDTNGPEKQA